MREAVCARKDATRERLGKVLDGRYRLEAHLGSGGTGAVYCARVLSNDRATGIPSGVSSVAIKVLHPHLVSNPSLREAFVKEARIARLVAHAGAVRVFDARVSADGTAYLVMELLDGRSLQEGLVGWGDLLVDEVVRVVRGILEVLAAAHERGVVHCDVKPENVFVLGDGTVKLLDFGVARITGEARRTGIAGTLAFMAPEQARGDWSSVDARSDVWSVAATFTTLITGRPLAPGAQVAFPDSVPPLLVDVIRRALARERERRWADAREMLEAFNDAARRSGIPRSSRSLALHDDRDPDESGFTLVVPPYAVSLDDLGPASSRPNVLAQRSAPSRRSRFLFGALVIAAAGVIGAALAFVVTSGGHLEGRARVPKALSSAHTTSADVQP